MPHTCTPKKNHFTVKNFFGKIQDTAQNNQFSAEKINSVSIKITVPVKRKESNNKKNQFRANKTHLMLERKSKLVPAKN